MQFKPVVQNFETVHPQGKNSTYSRLPDGRWLRQKTATGEVHAQAKTVFVHPSYGQQAHPRGNEHVSTYNPLELAANPQAKDLVGPGGRIGFHIMDPQKRGEYTVGSVPKEHISNEPQPGWYPVEYTERQDGSIQSYHLGHPVAPFKKGNFRA